MAQTHTHWGRNNKAPAFVRCPAFVVGGYARMLGCGNRIYRVLAVTPAGVTLQYLGIAGGARQGPAKRRNIRTLPWVPWALPHLAWYSPCAATQYAPSWLA